jgi:hypothetical protein
MTREEHIQQAEKLLREYRDKEPGLGYGVWHPTKYELKRAEIHALLANAIAAGPQG